MCQGMQEASPSCSCFYSVHLAGRLWHLSSVLEVTDGDCRQIKFQSGLILASIICFQFLSGSI